MKTEKTFILRTEVESSAVAGGTRVVVRTSIVDGSTRTDIADVSQPDRGYWTAVEGGNTDYPAAVGKTKHACIARYINDCEIRHLRFAAYRSAD